jgi:sterol desaturase/sphingolipid hydroxylase (fatty acid hydroxylase superfamily)
VPLYLKFYFWLLLVSAVVFVLERVFARDPKQEIVRADFVQDLFWMALNTQYVSWMLAIAGVHLARWLNAAFFHFHVSTPDSLALIATWPVALQFVVFLVSKDFLEWNVHRTLHRVPWLWELHKLHHSSERLDWLATFRAHWGEMIIYKFVIYLPLVVLGVDDRVVFAILVFSLFMQELVHANLNWDLGPLRYVLNSPRLHAWHHAVEMHGPAGQNFGITLSIWDWLFRTAYWPTDQRAPTQLGFSDMQSYPRTAWARLWNPFFSRRPKVTNSEVATESSDEKKAALARSPSS